MVNKFEQWKAKNVPNRPARPWDLLDPRIKRVSDDVQKRRFDICLSCDMLVKSTHQCKKCGCFMKAKTTLPNASCPLGKWLEEIPKEEV